jgi:hypothetical protein
MKAKRIKKKPNTKLKIAIIILWSYILTPLVLAYLALIMYLFGQGFDLGYYLGLVLMFSPIMAFLIGVNTL